MSEQTLGREVFEKVSEYIESMAAGLGVAAAHVYEIMARQMVVEGIVYASIYLAMIIGIPIIAYKAARATMRNGEYLERTGFDFFVFGAWVIGGIIAIIAFLVSIFSLPVAIMKAANPEYYVIREILEIFGGGGSN